MTRSRERIASSVPRAAVVLHDLAMVWVTWTGLHLVRYAMRSEPSPLASWSAETALVLLAQGLDHVEVVHGPEPPQQKAPFGKFRQVIAGAEAAPVRSA